MLDIGMEFKQGILFVRLKGIIKKDTAQIIEENITSTIKNNGIKYLLINFENVTYIDKNGIDLIARNYRLIKALNGKFIICGIKPFINYNNENLDHLYQIDMEDKAYEVLAI